MRPIRALLLAFVSAVIAAVAVYALVVRPRLKVWGVAPGEADLPLSGDELIGDPTAIETRGITIDAPVAKVWPWLVQMGYGRAGWYSYDMLDNKGQSADRILAEYQTLYVGDVMPTHPGGGFIVKAVEPERALVLYTDTEIVRSQADKAQREGTAELPAPGLKASGAMLSASYPEFAASWAFFLQPTEEGTTRLIERFRARTPGTAPASVIMGEVMGTGIVLMTRKQMLSIKDLVERATEPEIAPEVAPEVAREIAPDFAPEPELTPESETELLGA